MSGFTPEPGTLAVLSGPPRARGRAQAGLGDPGDSPGALAERVRIATVARVEAARAEGWLTPERLNYVAAQRAFAAAEDPEGLEELAGIAEGFGLEEAALFLHLHLGTLRDLAGGATLAGDGCSAWAVGAGPDGPLVVKNRDFSGTHRGVQRLVWHAGPDIATGGMVCLGSLGSPGAYSSGMNAAGLAVADTQIGARTHRVGWLRYFAMTRLLARCATVAEALDWLCARPHAGGGSLILADAGGATAAVELGADRVAVAQDIPVRRTNHFLCLAGETLTPTGRIGGNTAARLAFLDAQLPGRVWDVAAAARLMATHAADPGGAPVCQHPGPDEDTLTLSSVIFATRPARVYFHDGTPCAGRWRSFAPPG